MIIITGASKGIGKYLFETYSKIDPNNVIGTYNSSLIKENNERNYYKVDISEQDVVKQWIDEVKESLSDIILINCAAISYSKYAHKSDIEMWKKVIDVNLIGTFYVIHCLLPLMREQKYGRIINFSSIVTKLPTPGVSAYAASKAAIEGLTKSLSVENALLGITVNAINLGYVNLGMGINDVPNEYKEKIQLQIPVQRFCEPQEIFNTINYIINTPYLNGACIDLNGALL